MVDSTTILVYTKIFPFLAVFSTMLIFAFLMFSPRSLKVMFGSWLTRRAGALMFIANDDGFLTLDFCKGDMGQGIFTGKIANYIFTPRPMTINTETEETRVDITDKQKRIVDNAIQYRYITDFGKPVYFVYLGKSVGVSPRLLELMQKLRPGADKNATYLVDGLDARLLKSYLPGCFAPSLIDSLTFQHEKIGYYSRPLDKIKEKVVPIGIILVVIALIYLVATGTLKIPGIGPE